eukprot:TRINITY_DN15165_c0_g1_i1.p1 TRINITY_DN15165_c0_g1~~TRINITY_DN15165_c0_g1_i1.p1  ORF type:complete len:155 (+),score=21.31 TRINITY_DN15165_c0_g1_i1:111-575(+)
MIRRPPRSTQSRSSAASDVYKRQGGTEIQAAIWTLIDNDIPVSGQVGIVFDQTKVDYIVAEARAKGRFYLPECDGYVAVLLDQGCVDALNNNTAPNVTTQQSIFWLPMSSFPNAYEYSYGECANAWGKGKRFNYTGWGMYFLSLIHISEPTRPY